MRWLYEEIKKRYYTRFLAIKATKDLVRFLIQTTPRKNPPPAIQPILAEYIKNKYMRNVVPTTWWAQAPIPYAIIEFFIFNLIEKDMAENYYEIFNI
ncbi:MAG: hypothetical protein LBT55_06620 [Clostridiaceae bacterium]|nr:hypothetical protein [Clostridiaceae bacterium]